MINQIKALHFKEAVLTESLQIIHVYCHIKLEAVSMAFN